MCPQIVLVIRCYDIDGVVETDNESVAVAGCLFIGMNVCRWLPTHFTRKFFECFGSKKIVKIDI